MSENESKEVTSVLVQEILREKRSDRRWRNFRFICWFGLIAFLTWWAFAAPDAEKLPAATKSPYIALVRLDGMIAPGKEFSAEQIVPDLHAAFSDKRAAGVIILIDSPGGTPVQSAIIHDAIVAYKKKYRKKVIVVGEDMLTSGAYYISVAADKIYVNPNTLTGSIGVIMKGFGFVELMKKMGVERRVYVAGDHKDRLDPFLPQTPEDEAKIRQVMAEVHQNFVQAVLEGRKGKLKADPQTLFTGDFWSGQGALQLGLVDSLGNLMDAMDKEFGTTRYREYGGSPSFFKLLSGQLNTAIDRWVYLQ